MWLLASAYWWDTRIYASECAQIWKRKKKESLTMSCRRMTNNENEFCLTFFVSFHGGMQTLHSTVHIPVTQRLSSSGPGSIRPQQRSGHIETLLSLTTSQSITGDYRPEGRAVECDDAVLFTH